MYLLLHMILKNISIITCKMRLIVFNVDNLNFNRLQFQTLITIL